MWLRNGQFGGEPLDLNQLRSLIGHPVYDTDGEKVGKLLEVPQEGNYLLMQKGWVYRRDLYLPLDAVDHIDTEGVYLHLTKTT
jgi:hypothetical protein